MDVSHLDPAYGESALNIDGRGYAHRDAARMNAVYDWTLCRKAGRIGKFVVPWGHEDQSRIFFALLGVTLIWWPRGKEEWGEKEEVLAYIGGRNPVDIWEWKTWVEASWSLQQMQARDALCHSENVCRHGGGSCSKGFIYCFESVYRVHTTFCLQPTVERSWCIPCSRHAIGNTPLPAGDYL